MGMWWAAPLTPGRWCKAEPLQQVESQMMENTEMVPRGLQGLKERVAQLGATGKSPWLLDQLRNGGSTTAPCTGVQGAFG